MGKLITKFNLDDLLLASQETQKREVEKYVNAGMNYFQGFVAKYEDAVLNQKKLNRAQAEELAEGLLTAIATLIGTSEDKIPADKIGADYIKRIGLGLGMTVERLADQFENNTVGHQEIMQQVARMGSQPLRQRVQLVQENFTRELDSLVDGPALRKEWAEAFHKRSGSRFSLKPEYLQIATAEKLMQGYSAANATPDDVYNIFGDNLVTRS